jgi:Domain of unknown function (DUF1918)
MEFKVGDRVVAESESTERPPRFGTVEEVIAPGPPPRLRIRWDEGRETILTPAAGSLAHARDRQGESAAARS